MKHKLNYTIEVGRKLTTLFICFFLSQNQRAKAGLMAFRSLNFHAMYLAAGSFALERDAAEPHSLKLRRSFNIPKAPGIRECSHQSRGCY